MWATGDVGYWEGGQMDIRDRWISGTDGYQGQMDIRGR